MAELVPLSGLQIASPPSSELPGAAPDVAPRATKVTFTNACMTTITFNEVTLGPGDSVTFETTITL